MPQLNLYSAPVLFAAVLNIFLIALVMVRLAPGPVRRAFLLWDFVLMTWNFGVFGIFGAQTEASAMLWNKLCYHGIVWIPAVFLHLVLTVQGHRRWWQQMLLVGMAVLGGSLLVGEHIQPGFLASSVVQRFWGYLPVGGKGTLILDPLLGGSAIYSLVLLFNATKKESALNKTQLQYLLLGATIAFIGGGINVMMIHGAPIYPFGNLLNIVYSVCVSYAILSYSWVNVRVAISRVLVYSLLCTLLSLLCAQMARLIEYLQTAGAGLVNLNSYVLAVLPVLAMAPVVKNRLQRWIERWFFRDLTLLRTHIQEWVSLSHNVERLRRILGFPGMAVWSWDGHQFSPVAVAGIFPQTADSDLLNRGASFFQSTTSSVWMTAELLWRQRVDPIWDARWNPVVEWLKNKRVSLVLPLEIKGEFKGVWLFGPASGAENLPVKTLKQLKLLSTQVAEAIQRPDPARAAENSLMGMFAAELAHELARPLTHIQNEKARLERRLTPEMADQSLKRISKEIQRATEMLDSFSLLAPDRTLHRLQIPLQQLMDEALDGQGELLDQIEVVRDYDSVAPVHVNPGQIVQVFSNVLQNALQAMGGVGTLSVRLRETNSEITAVVEDTGPGIPSDLQQRIFEAFFSTKKKHGGRGVGLTLSRAMIERHGGQIQIESPVQNGKGTRVSIRIPHQSLNDQKGKK